MLLLLHFIRFSKSKKREFFSFFLLCCIYVFSNYASLPIDHLQHCLYVHNIIAARKAEAVNSVTGTALLVPTSEGPDTSSSATWRSFADRRFPRDRGFHNGLLWLARWRKYRSVENVRRLSSVSGHKSKSCLSFVRSLNHSFIRVVLLCALNDVHSNERRGVGWMNEWMHFGYWQHMGACIISA